MSDARHPNDYDLYTPITPELLGLLARMRQELGSWREIAAATGVRTRQLRRLHRVEVSVVSQTFLDNLCTATGVGSVREFEWFTANDLVALGIWPEVVYLDGRRSRYEAGLRGEPRVMRRRASERRVDDV